MNKQEPPEIVTNETKYVKITQRQTKDQDPFKTVKVKENNTMTFKDTNNVKIHKNRLKH